MIQNLRENLKGTVAVVFIGFILLAMVVSGEQLIATSLSDDVASVNGEDITTKDLQRAIMQERARLRNQYQLEDSAEQLKEENLRQPALNALIREKALVQAAQRAGMGVSDEVVKDVIKQGFSQNNQFNQQLFTSYLNQFGHTQASLIERESQGYLARQLLNGLADTTFVTQKDVDLLASIAGQKRSFNVLSISKDKVAKGVSVNDEEIAQFYKDNEKTFTEPEKVILQYLEISVEEMAKAQVVSDEEVKEAFEKELAAFDASPELSIAHILIEKGGDTAAAEKKIAEVKAKLDAGEAFESLAKAYSDDLGSKELGGELGVMTGDAYPAAFKTAVAALNEGQVSAAIPTEAGTHFVKLLKKSQPTPPELAARKDSIKLQLATDKASEKFSEQLKLLDELTFGKDNLESAAQAIGSTVKVTPAFERSGGEGIAANGKVIEAAFAKDVLEQGQNSKVIEMPGDKAVVVRLKEHLASRVKPLQEIKPQVVETLTRQKISTQLQALAQEAIAKIQAGSAAETYAKSQGFAFAKYDAVDRFKSIDNREAMQHAFSMLKPAEGQSHWESFATAEGAQLVIGLTAVVKGEVKDLDPQQLAAMRAQVESQVSADELTAYETVHFSTATVKM
jgi:peptidyl-prolyl cis-trans isomerase D